MQSADRAYHGHVLARLTDYFMSEGIPWTRRLWDVGSILALEELWEAGVWQPKKVIAGSAMDWQRHELRRLVGPDLGMGESDLRRELDTLLDSGELSDPKRSGKAIAADRLAAIVACSWPRAELTTLVHRHGGTGPMDELVRRRDSCSTNRERARLLLEEITANGLSNLRFNGATRHSDLAAAERMKDCIAEPSRVVREVTKAVQVALRRLYRARNMVLHGGSTSSVVLDAALRTAAPLVGGETTLSLIDLLQQPSDR
jgi:hypothetical protein